MKLSDEFMDEAGNKKLAIITGILCVVFTLLVSVTNSDAACIFLSILIGTALASKVDSVNHILSAILFVVILAIAGFPHFSLVCLVVCTIAAFVDEKGNDYSDEQIENNKGGFIITFFKYRYALKIAVLIFSLISIVNMYLPGSMFCNFNFSAITFVDFLLFDLSYEFIGSHFDRINNFLN